MQHRYYDTSPIVSALNLILTFLPQRMGVVVGRNRYFSPQIAEPFRLGGGVEAWKGIYASVRPTYKQLMVNANLCITSFYTPGNLAHVMNAFLDATFGARMDAFFRRIRVEVTHLGYRKIVKKLVSLTARTCSFDTPEYGHVTLEDFCRLSELGCTSIFSCSLIQSFSP